MNTTTTTGYLAPTPNDDLVRELVNKYKTDRSNVTVSGVRAYVMDAPNSPAYDVSGAELQAIPYDPLEEFRDLNPTASERMDTLYDAIGDAHLSNGRGLPGTLYIGIKPLRQAHRSVRLAVLDETLDELVAGVDDGVVGYDLLSQIASVIEEIIG